MADILIPNMKKPLKGMYEEIRVWDDGRVDIYDCESECYIPTTKAIELPSHNDLADKSVIIERMENAYDELWGKVDEEALSECHVAFLKAVMQAPVVLEASE